MSQFDAFAKASLAPFMTRVQGRRIAFTPQGGNEKTILAIPFQPPPDPSGTPKTRAQSIHLLISRADVPVISKGGDKATIDGAVYVITSIVDSQSPGMWAVEATKETGRGL